MAKGHLTNLVKAVAAIQPFVATVGNLKDYERRLSSIPIPLGIELRLSAAWPVVERLTDSEWRELRRSIDDPTMGCLIVYGTRMASYAVRQHSPEIIHHGLMGLVLDNDKMDYRDVIITGCLLYDASERIGCAPRVLFRDAARFATKERQALLIEYAEGPESVHNIEEMGFLADDSPGGFLYKPDDE